MCAHPAGSPTAALLASYEAVPYGGGAIHATRPDYLAGIGRLYGLATPDVRRCRVLDIGCATGGNLLSMAVSIPDGTFLGIDLSPRQIAAAREAASSLGLTNVRFEAMSVTDVRDALGTFDYIVCHGVYSWVPPDAQEAILSVCARNLAPHGMAYVSYNTYPGWHSRGLVRDMLLFHDAPDSGPSERVQRSRDLLATMIEAVPQAEPGYAELLRQELELLGDASETYFIHEELEPENHPVYFAEFARRAEAAGLKYVCEAQPPLIDTQLNGDACARLRAWSGDRVQYEQYLDFARNRTFRRSLLCHAGREVAAEPVASGIPGLWLRARCFFDASAPESTPDADVFRTTDGVSITLEHSMVRAALHVLADARPASLHFTTLVDETRRRLTAATLSAETLADAMLRCALVRLVDVTAMPLACATHAATRPVASPLARFEACHGMHVSSLAHLSVSLAPFDRYVIRLLDGTRDADAVVDAVVAAVRDGALDLGGSVTRESIAEALAFALSQFALAALLPAS